MKNLIIILSVGIVAQLGFGQKQVNKPSYYSYHTECNCFTKAFNLGEIDLKIEIYKENGNFSGIVRENDTGEVIEGVLIYNVIQKDDKIYPKNKLTKTNSNGKFTINMESNEMKVIFHYLSYRANYYELVK